MPRTYAGRLAIIALLLAGALLVACGSDSGVAGADLEQATYLTENTDEGEATLEGGEFRAPVVPGSSAEMVIQLGKWTAGDIDGQGGEDAAAITIEQPGGSGTFHYVHALVADDGELRDAGVAFLGDRIRVEGVSIHNGVITIALLDRPPEAAMASEPTVAVIRRFALEGGELVEIEAPRSAAAFACDGSLPDAALVVVQAPLSGAAVASGFGVSGCSRTFESNVNWRLFDRQGLMLAKGFTSGGGVDGPGPFAFAVEYELAERQLGYLEVFEDDQSGGEGFPPPRTIIPLVLEASR